MHFKNLFPNDTPCCTIGAYGSDECWLCMNPTERALRRYIVGAEMPPMTGNQRQHLLDSVERIGTGTYSRKAAEGFTDRTLAAWVFNAWDNYITSSYVSQGSDRNRCA